MTLTKALLTMSLIVILAGMLTACESLKIFGGETKNQLEAIIAVTAAGTYEVSYVVRRNGQSILQQSLVYECTQDAGRLTGCHQRNPAPAVAVPQP
jgi:hypothetical protein